MLLLSEKFFTSNWLVSLSVGIMLLLLSYFNFLQPLEQKIYDWYLQTANYHTGEEVAVIALDENSLMQLGELPWSRTILAQVIDLVAPYSKVIGIPIDFSKPQNFSGQIHIDDLMTLYKHSKPFSSASEELEALGNLIAQSSELRTRYVKNKRYFKQLRELYAQSTLLQIPEHLTRLEDKLQAAYLELDYDQQLANSMKAAGNVILGMSLTLSESKKDKLVDLANCIKKYRINNIILPNAHERLAYPVSSINAVTPIDTLCNYVAGIGYFDFKAVNENSRSTPLIVKYQESYLPSLALLLATNKLAKHYSQIEVELSKGIKINNSYINTSEQLELIPTFYQNATGLKIDSFVDVLTGRIDAKTYANKIVIIGITADNYTNFQATPLGEMPTSLVLAHTVLSLLNQDFFMQPVWANGLEIFLCLIIFAYINFLLPMIRERMSLIITSISLTMLSLLYIIFLTKGLLVHLIIPILFILLGHIGSMIQQGIIAYQDAFRLHPDAVESNRLLGLAFQGQGHLDLAFEKFRLCPLDDTISNLLYNLALDYERKQHFRHAYMVYRYIGNYKSTFRDIAQRLERTYNLKKSSIAGNSLDTWLFKGEQEKPILGRYQIEKILGKGAMGVVYLGQDTKLNRLVAIKTLPLSQEFGTEELFEATIRFFREATAAGRLTHNNIISVHEAGEEQDLAYIAMEFFKGGNLIPYTQVNNLLPVTTVIELIIKIAEALDYAHNQEVIHRDIKPANIMYNPVNNEIKIADFGIAHITDSNKTKTGIILGTPSYMSPEQISGKTLDGRTDLFSLGVMLYQLLTGTLPFQADSLATLMFKIANEPHIDILNVRSDIEDYLKDIVNMALQKEINYRYQTGIEFAHELQNFRQHGES